jgi:hypothetical protein
MAPGSMQVFDVCADQPLLERHQRPLLDRQRRRQRPREDAEVVSAGRDLDGYGVGSEGPIRVSETVPAEI